MTKIHSTAIIDENCVIGSNVEIGPYSVIRDNVRIGDGTKIYPFVHISGNTDIGNNNTIFQYSSIGSPPQDLKFNGEKNYLKIGDSNIFREGCTINPGTEGGGLTTEIGNDSLFMTGVHIAHDCIVGNNTVFANQATLGGHVKVGDRAVLGGLSAVHQFCRVGNLAMIGGLSAVHNDVIPYGLVSGNRAKLEGVNLIGLKRASYSIESIKEFSKVINKIFSSNSIMSKSKEFNDSKNELVTDLCNFIKEDSSRGLCPYAKK
tara:strand:+ start:1402 stop:2184 length:783 start_codon:yes stop_codon:yes gene_type:complete